MTWTAWRCAPPVVRAYSWGSVIYQPSQTLIGSRAVKEHWTIKVRAWQKSQVWCKPRRQRQAHDNHGVRVEPCTVSQQRPRVRSGSMNRHQYANCGNKHVQMSCVGCSAAGDVWPAVLTRCTLAEPKTCKRHSPRTTPSSEFKRGA